MKLKSAYRNFFIESVEGKHFVNWLKEIIESEHEKAEKTPELSRDHTQRAKGAREVLDHIKSVTG